MPYVWKDNEVAFEHNGVTIYHVHKHDMADCYKRDNFYHISPGGSEEDDECFDVRDIPHPEHLDHTDHPGILRYAIEQGWLTQEGLVLPDLED